MYHDTMVKEWINRGFKNNMPLLFTGRERKSEFPSWLQGDSAARLVDSHRSNLLRKDPVFYGKYGWDVPPDLPYYWPVTKADLEVKQVLSFCS